jgi:EAL domain-containing protein (putative c-di-GMP-specific phosphodiesterase class I)
MGELDRIVADALIKHGIAPHELELELTESTLMESTQRHKDVFGHLREIGVRLAIDDFGTGFSSLAYLSSFRITRLKLPIEFVHDVTTNPENAAIVRATIGLARALSIELIAEGVNTAEQQAFLLAAGCDFGQGYRFGEPVAADRTTEILQKMHRTRTDK